MSTAQEDPSAKDASLLDQEIFEKAIKRQRLYSKATVEGIDKIIQSLNQTKSALSMVQQQSEDEQRAFIQTAQQSFEKKSKSIMEEMNGQVKDYYAALSKMSKYIERKFTLNLDLAHQDGAFDGQDELLDEAVAMHLLRQGHFDLVETFCKEAHIHLDSNLCSNYKLMFEILHALRQRDLSPALNWAREHRGSLEGRGSHLEFRLHQLHFTSLLLEAHAQSQQQDPQSLQRARQLSLEAITYARREFAWFADTNLREIQRLMTSTLFTGRQNSTYADVLRPALWEDVEREFSREYCTWMGMCAESPLSVLIEVGASAIPTVIKVKSVIGERTKNRPKAEMWSMADELPTEIAVSKKYRFHSVFTCPVSKEQTTETNPAMMLPCGHIICRESLIRLSKSKSGVQSQTAPGQLNPQAKVKCPYCPNESTGAQAMKVNF